MIEHRIIQELKRIAYNAVRNVVVAFAMITALLLIAPSNAFEQNADYTYSGKELIEVLPETHKHLVPLINPNSLYMKEDLVFFFATLIMGFLVFLCYVSLIDSAAKLRKLDTPPPVIPSEEALNEILLKSGVTIWFIFSVVLAIFWSNQSDEYILSGSGILNAFLTNLPFWILIGLVGVVFFIETLIGDLVDKEKFTH